MIRIAFLGTPEAAVPSLEVLAKGFEVLGVVTQPDRPRGRGRTLERSPVGQAAADIGLPVAQPDNDDALTSFLHGLHPIDVAVVVAYGRILKPEMLAIPRLGFVNLHFSLLPRWRGAAPVERSLMEGDTMSGVSIIKIDEGLDTGPVLNAQGIDVGPNTTGGALTSTLANVGARLLAATLAGYVSGDIVPAPQTDEGATYARKLAPSDRAIDPSQPREVTRNRVRALNPSPGATLRIDGETFKVLEVSPSAAALEEGSWSLIEGLPMIGCADGALVIELLQPPGKPPRSGVEWARGARRAGGVVG